MDGFDLFRKLGVGTKFDFKRFKSDANVLNLLPAASVSKSATKKARLDAGHEQQESDNEVQEAPDVNHEKHTEEGDLTVLQGLKKKGEKQRTKKSKQSFAQMKQEKINHIRNKNRIHCFGQDPPNPCTSFEQLAATYGLNPQIIKNIASIGYTQPTPIQIQAIPAMMDRREILACAPTGSGKTAAFLLPIMHHLKEHKKKGYRALILAPTRELAKQIYREFLRLSEGVGLKAHYISKSTTEKRLEKKYDVLVSTPNRLVYMLQEDPPLINLSQVEWLVIDESDKLFEDGKTGFRDQLAKVYQACNSNNVKRAMFSATFAVEVEEWCKLNLDNVLQVYIGAKNSATTTIEQELKFVGTESGKLLAVRDIIAKGVQPPVLIFVQSKERARELFHELIYDGMNVDVIHSDQTQEQRDNAVKNFRSGKTWILICTELMGRGMDFIGVNLVINYDFPNSAISYIHRIGRTGRAGRSGRAITFFTENDSMYLRSIARVMVNAGCPVPNYMLDMKRPNKKIRRAAKRVPKRDRISTVSQYDIDKLNKKRKYISKDKGKSNKRAKLKRGAEKS
ncbi:probable ATP-dependent RNA helicase DDX52 [Crassostrea angulata]|uniref:probable ATP-dependent RNA helicase DDX52 n=1 Tax=Magallana angulata TaxID=2784310 RepID=UPI0022B18A56|nr:probable ATP-dependent RNA helicase DDX52 [Crassostrea angulata]